MPVPTRVVGELHQLRTRRIELRNLLDDHLSSGSRDGREQMLPKEKAMLGELRQLDDRIKFQESEVERAGHPQFGQPGRTPGHALGTAGHLSPLGFPDEELRRMQSAAMRGESCRLESREFSTADALLPSGLYPWPVGAQHEGRLLDRLPGIAMEAPSITFIRHVSTTGAAHATGEGQLNRKSFFTPTH